MSESERVTYFAKDRRTPEERHAEALRAVIDAIQGPILAEHRVLIDEGNTVHAKLLVDATLAFDAQKLNNAIRHRHFAVYTPPGKKVPDGVVLHNLESAYKELRRASGGRSEAEKAADVAGIVAAVRATFAAPAAPAWLPQLGVPATAPQPSPAPAPASVPAPAPAPQPSVDQADRRNDKIRARGDRFRDNSFLIGISILLAVGAVVGVAAAVTHADDIGKWLEKDGHIKGVGDLVNRINRILPPLGFTEDLTRLDPSDWNDATREYILKGFDNSDIPRPNEEIQRQIFAEGKWRRIIDGKVFEFTLREADNRVYPDINQGSLKNDGVPWVDEKNKWHPGSEGRSAITPPAAPKVETPSAGTAPAPVEAPTTPEKQMVAQGVSKEDYRTAELNFERIADRTAGGTATPTEVASLKEFLAGKGVVVTNEEAMQIFRDGKFIGKDGGQYELWRVPGRSAPTPDGLPVFLSTRLP
ncbi:MAG: hypothetical protein AAB955_01815 [Patescibacteria group bacterium]